MTRIPELRALTGLRGIAAWAVVLFHIRYSITGLAPTPLAIVGKGYLAVDFFFMLSGFVIWLSWHERIRGGDRTTILLFLQRRIARIWPLHIVMLGFGVALAVALVAVGRPDPERFPFEHLPYHVLLIQNWGFVRALDWNDPAWSISTELFAYLVFPLLVLRLDWRRVPTPAILVAIAALIAVLAGIMTLRGLKGIGDFIPQFGLLRCVTEFGCGTAIGALWLRYHEAPRTPAVAAALVALGGFVLFASGLLVEMASIPIAFAGLLLAAALTANAPGNPLAGRALHRIGELSYATYLSHSLLWKAFKLVFDHDPRGVSPIGVVFFLAIVAVASVALHQLIERPVQRWMSRKPNAALTPSPQAPLPARR